MSDASTLFRTFTIKSGEKEWPLKRPNLLTEAAFARKMEAIEGAFVARQRLHLGPQVHQDAVREHLSRGVRNWFGWCRPGFYEALEDPKNVAEFLRVWVAQCHPEKIAGPDGKPAPNPLWLDGAAAYKLYLEEKESIDAAINEAISDPNPLPPE